MTSPSILYNIVALTLMYEAKVLEQSKKYLPPLQVLQSAMPLIRKQVTPTNSGMIKWYNAATGYGFVTVIAAQEYDILIHFSEFVDKCAALSAHVGELLLFNIQVGIKGAQATDIVVAQDIVYIK